MSLSTPFIRRPVATLLLTAAIVLAGLLCYRLLPVAPLPDVSFPTIVVSASVSGASPDTMAASVATPLEQALGRIGGITQLTSNSSLGSTSVVVQFGLDKDIDAAAREVQAAINAAADQLPSAMTSLPNYRKMNPSDAPIMAIALTSPTRTTGELYDLASETIAPRIAQIAGVGEVDISGSSTPAVRVELNPDALNQYGIGLDTVASAIRAANASSPKGAVESASERWAVDANDQLRTAADYQPLIVRHSDGSIVRLRDVGTVSDSVQNSRNIGFFNDEPAVLMFVRRQPSANIVKVIEDIRAEIPGINEILGSEVKLTINDDRGTGIRASLAAAEEALVVAVALVILVVFAFLRSPRAALIPTVAVPVSLVGTFAVMYLFGFSLNNLSLMALIVATGFVVDDAIVVVENVQRLIEQGMPPREAALQGAKQVSFTVLSMSVSLIAVFLPILLMGGITGLFFREFSVTLAAAILISLLVSLTLTPMLCSRVLRARPQQAREPGRIGRALAAMVPRYRASLAWALDHSGVMMFVLLSCVVMTVMLFNRLPKGLFPDQDTGSLRGMLRGDQSIAFESLETKMKQVRDIILDDPAVESLVGFAGASGGWRTANSGNFFVKLKPFEERGDSDEIIARLRTQFAEIPGISVFLMMSQDVRVGGRESDSSYEYTLRSDDLALLRKWQPLVESSLKSLPQITDVSGGGRDNAVQIYLDIDRDRARSLGVDVSDVTSVLSNAYGQRQVSSILDVRNQYYVVMEVAAPYRRNAEILRQVYVHNADGARIPLSEFVSVGRNNAPLRVEHQDQFAATTFSFNLNEGVPLDDAKNAIRQAVGALKLPNAIHGSFEGTAGAATQTANAMPALILLALLAVYVVLGILYESYIHPITILSTLPSAGVGALFALLISQTELTLVALIGVILLIGIVKKNAILMVDFALEAERRHGLAPREAILDAGVKRFRPIIMTTLAAILGALPLLLANDADGSLRRPLGITIIGGLIGSQLLTLYTTPVVYLLMDRMRHRFNRRIGQDEHLEEVTS